MITLIEVHLWDKYGIEIALVDATFLRGSRGEMVPDEGFVYIDKQTSCEERLEIVAHEFGHLLLHHRQLGPFHRDLLRGSVFLDQGAAGLARYSPRSQEEAEASAFAAELICPAKEIFEAWIQDATATAEGLSAKFASTPALVRIQLAEGLYRQIVGEAPTEGADTHPTTPEQERAATTTGVPVLVDAGPGTGKTKTLVRRIEHLITDKEIAPERILVLTFSNEAAAELSDRLEGSLGKEVASQILTSTFHGFGVLLLHALGDRAGLDVDYSILDEAAQEETILDLLGRVSCDPILDLKEPTRSAVEIASLISYLKDRLLGPDELREAIESWETTSADAKIVQRAEALLRVFEAYEETKKQHNKVDFADLILLPYRILLKDEEVRTSLRAEFPWVLIDEYQDVSRATALFLQQIAGPANPPWVVGDARQAIYRFRGADPENVRRFTDDFPGGITFQLQDNYRSAPEIIDAANQLAALLEHSDETLTDRWKPGRSISAFGERPVRRVLANSDQAEREGIAEVVRQWRVLGIEEKDIAVLARRNVDVRNIALALKERGIRAVTTGILTAEGAGGDLAAVLTAVDQPIAMARVIFSLNRGVSSDVLNAAVRQLLVSEVGGEEPCWTSSTVAQAVGSSGWKVREELRVLRHSDDAWSILTNYLFFQTGYLRALMEGQEDDAEASVQLEEILSTLALAASYRFTHPHESPRRSRLGFTERLRNLLTHPAPGLIPPRKQTKAVRVMTCHAAKGLEFPCVVVAGQSLPDLLRKDASLPPALRPDKAADLLQADSLLFVGVTRAERAVLISHASSASGTPNSRPRKLPKLLELWLASLGHESERWERPPSSSEEIMIGRIWGGEPPARISMYSLGSDACRVKVYLEEQLGARFRGRDYPLYREFIRRVRNMLAQVVQRALATGAPVSADVAGEIADEAWPLDAFHDHPHFAIYRPRARRWTEQFAAAFRPSGRGGGDLLAEAFEWIGPLGEAAELGLHLIGRFRTSSGEQVAIALQAEASDKGEEHANWSNLKAHHRLPFILLQDRDGDVQPLVLFGEDGRLLPFRWSRRNPQETLKSEAGAAKQAFVNLVEGKFDGTVSDWACDRCPCRIVCPWWIGAAMPPGEPESPIPQA